MAIRLTETAITKAAREAGEAHARRDLSDTVCPGLRLRLTAAGGKSWVLACRDREGRMRRFPLGSFPAVGIAEAREQARTLHVMVRQAGADPIAERKRERAAGQDAKAGIGTLRGLLGTYGDHKGGKLKSWAECRRRIESVFQPHMDRPPTTLTAGDLQQTADRWPSQQSAAAAVRYIRPVLKWASHRRYSTADLASIVPPATVGRRDRVLSRDELVLLLPVLRDSERPYAACMRFLLLTLTRREEASAARWRDINLAAGTWTLARTKNAQPHLVPLSRQALALLRECLPRDADGKVIDSDPAALVFATRSGGPLCNWDRETKAIMEASGTEGWTRHDLRRTGATMLGDMGELPDIIEAALNHVAIRSQIAATYNRSRYRPQVAAALQRLGDALDGIEASSATIVTLFGKA